MPSHTKRRPLAIHVIPNALVTTALKNLEAISAMVD